MLLLKAPSSPFVFLTVTQDKMDTLLQANYTPYSAKDFTKLDRDWSKFPGLSYTFKFEENLLDNLDDIREYVRGHTLLPLVLSAFYCISVRLLRSWMDSCPAFHLRIPLIVWNASLTVFSIFGCVRVLPEVFWTLKYRGLFASTCDHRFIDDSRVFLWIFLFTFSKVAEFIDTLFIILRKQKLLTLHWIHHAWTLVYCWYTMINLPAHSRWLCAMNFFVHSIMYGYYAIMASGFRVPRSMAQVVTLLQIAQMTFGLYTQGQALWLSETNCEISWEIATFGFLMYFTFWALFIKFFIDKYLLVEHRQPGTRPKRD